jgi:hypothetical protein
MWTMNTVSRSISTSEQSSITQIHTPALYVAVPHYTLETHYNENHHARCSDDGAGPGLRQ